MNSRYCTFFKTILETILKTNCFHSAKYKLTILPSKSPSCIVDMRFSCISNFFNRSNDVRAWVGTFVSSFPPKLSLLSFRLEPRDLKAHHWKFYEKSVVVNKLSAKQATQFCFFFFVYKRDFLYISLLIFLRIAFHTVDESDLLIESFERIWLYDGDLVLVKSEDFECVETFKSFAMDGCDFITVQIQNQELMEVSQRDGWDVSQ